MIVVYGDSSRHICGGSDHCITRSDVSHVPCPEVCSTHVQPEVAQYPPWCGLLTGCESRDPDQKYVLRMPGFFLSNSNMATRWSHPPSGFPWVCAWTTGSCATPVVTEAHVIPLEVSLGCSLRRPRPMAIGNPTSYI
jgi:hypothetical protein